MKEFRDSAYIDESAVLALNTILLIVFDRSCRSHRGEKYLLSIQLLGLTFSLTTVIYMHQALDGTLLEADRPFIPTLQVPTASFKLKISITHISEYRITTMRPCPDWRRVLSGV